MSTTKHACTFYANYLSYSAVCSFFSTSSAGNTGSVGFLFIIDTIQSTITVTCSSSSDI